jgi:hypothetical protein
MDSDTKKHIDEQIKKNTRELQSLIGMRGAIQKIGSGAATLSHGITVGTGKTQIDTDGNFFVGSDLSDPSTTSFSAFVETYAYNAESMEAGDILIGNNSDGMGNVKWSALLGQLQFRNGTTPGAYIDTNGGIVLSNTGAYITIGTTPPTSATVGTGIWIDKNGIVALSANVQNATLTSAGLSAGKTTLDGTGINTAISLSSPTSLNAYRFTNAGVDYSLLAGFAPSGQNNLELTTLPIAGRTSIIGVYSQAPSGEQAQLQLLAYCDISLAGVYVTNHGAGSTTIELDANATTVDGTLGVTGVTTIGDGSGVASEIFNGAAGNSRQLVFQTGGVVRNVLVGATIAAEGGANSGSNININNYSDAGNLLQTAMTIIRATGVIQAPVGIEVYQTGALTPGSVGSLIVPYISTQTTATDALAGNLAGAIAIINNGTTYKLAVRVGTIWRYATLA